MADPRDLDPPAATRTVKLPITFPPLNNLQAVRQREELASLRRLALEMQARHPDVTRAVEAAVQGEQAVQEERNRRSLELLSAKDAALKAAAVQVWCRGEDHGGREVQPV